MVPAGSPMWSRSQVSVHPAEGPCLTFQTGFQLPAWVKNGWNMNTPFTLYPGPHLWLLTEP